LHKYISFIARIWDPRPLLAKQWFESAEKYEERLRANTSLDPQIIELVIQERNRIHLLFTELLPTFAGRISIVVTVDGHAEHCSVFVWEKRLYVLVSGALLGRPYDHPNEPGLKAWQWLARHEAAHIRNNHLFWFFHTRRFFRIPYLLCGAAFLFLRLFASTEIFWNWAEPCLWILTGLWLLQTIVGLTLEWKADLSATASIQDKEVLEDAEKSLHRMGVQAKTRLPSPFGWIQYLINIFFFDPHPPLRARRWLLQRRIRQLQEQSCFLENRLKSTQKSTEP